MFDGIRVMDSGIPWVGVRWVICVSIGGPTARGDDADGFMVGCTMEGFDSTSVINQRWGGVSEVGKDDGGCSEPLA